MILHDLKVIKKIQKNDYPDEGDKKVEMISENITGGKIIDKEFDSEPKIVESRSDSQSANKSIIMSLKRYIQALVENSRKGREKKEF